MDSAPGTGTGVRGRDGVSGGDVNSGTHVSRPEPARNSRGSRNARGERGPFGLEGGGRSTQVSPAEAMRAREFGRPTAEDLAAAEEQVVLVRRNYVPPTPLPQSARQQASRQQSTQRSDQRQASHARDRGAGERDS